MNNGPILWNKLGAKWNPNNDNLVCSPANKAKTTEPCSSIDQNKTEAMNKGIYANTRERSTLVIFLLLSINTK